MKKVISLLLFFFGLLAVTYLFNMVGSADPTIPARAISRASASSVQQVRGLLLVNANNPLPTGYEPEQLVTLYGQSDRSFALATSDISLEEQVFEAMNRMFTQATQDGVNEFIITSGYRTREKQRQLYADSPEGIAAAPGTSEHETGLAFDVTCYRNGGGFEESEQFDWLNAHCWDYGFIIRYPEDKEHITGIRYEPWHYRYVGVDAALAIRDAELTLEEYVEAS